MIKISDKSLTIGELVQVARNYVQVELDDVVIDKIKASRASVEQMLEGGRIVYGITTGFGSLANKAIDAADVQELQKNLIVSHATGVGAPFSEDVVRAMLLLRAKSLSQGYSGVRLELIQALIDMLNKKVTPIVPEKGSLGSSGDLCPLSHMVLPLLGEGEAIFQGVRMSGADAMEKAGIKQIVLEAKEGLALNNGTQCMTAVGALAVYDAWELFITAEKVASMSLEALNGRTDAFDPRIHQVRGQVGQRSVSAKILEHTKGSTFINNSVPCRDGGFRVQDAYALRCIPQVLGASLDALNYVSDIIENEMNAVTDNPLIFGDDAISGGNFHGQPVALAMDFLGIAMAEVASISERRTERMVNPDLSNGLPAYLVAQDSKKGLHSGFMIVQYAAAALVSENKILAHPASVDSIPSSNNQEDHVSMGTIAARKAAEIIENALQVVAMEALTAAQAIDLRLIKPDWSENQDKWFGEKPSALGAATRPLYEQIRAKVPAMMKDRVIAPDIAAVADLIRQEKL
ncbi:MAG: histidine ammonia-lyase [Defluviitaleaceae bacterium]|nr:histidine ammonia-lyase [Defluviitaleaceae bacterium]